MQMSLRLTLIFVLFFFQLNSDAQTVIKMRRLGGVSVISCKVNGLKLDFIFDTGASDVSISLTEVLFMMKNGYLSKDDIIGTNKYFNADGDLNEGLVVNLKEIEIAGIKLYNVKASTVKNLKAPLLLGQTAISKLGKIQLDLVSNTITILSANSPLTVSNDSIQNIKNEKTTSPIKSIFIDTLEVSIKDIADNLRDEFTWEEAKRKCKDLGEGWRLPTKEELNLLHQKKDSIGGFSRNYYWSKNEIDSVSAWSQYFGNFSDIYGKQFIQNKKDRLSVRPIRTINSILKKEELIMKKKI